MYVALDKDTIEREVIPHLPRVGTGFRSASPSLRNR